MTDAKPEDPLPCHACGEPASYCDIPGPELGEDEDYHSVWCKPCDEWEQGTTRAAAIAAWNKRQSTDGEG